MENFTALHHLCERISPASSASSGLRDHSVDNPTQYSPKSSHRNQDNDMHKVKYTESDEMNEIKEKQNDNHTTTGTSTSEESDEKSKEKTQKCPLLPPCRVCGDQATGFHYGATTCEACKVGLIYFQMLL